MNYQIYHPYGGELNHDCQRGVYEYKQVATVQGYSLPDAFTKAQNDFNPDYEKLGVRSTCVGDIIQCGPLYYMVVNTGFVEVPPTVVQYIDWGNHMKDPTDLYNEQDYA